MSIEALDEEIRAIAQAVRKLRSGKLKDSTIHLLIREACPIKDRPTLKQIKTVLDAAENLEQEYLK